MLKGQLRLLLGVTQLSVGVKGHPGVFSRGVMGGPFHLSDSDPEAALPPMRSPGIAVPSHSWLLVGVFSIFKTAFLKCILIVHFGNPPHSNNEVLKSSLTELCGVG